MKTKKQQIIELYQQGVQDIKELAERVGTTRKYVRLVLTIMKNKEPATEPQSDTQEPQENTQEQPESTLEEKSEEQKPKIVKAAIPKEEQPINIKKVVITDSNEVEEEDEDNSVVIQARAESFSKVMTGIIAIVVEYLTPDKPLTKKEEKFLYQVYMKYLLSRPDIAENIPPEADVVVATATVLLPRWIEYIERKKREEENQA